MLGVSRGGSTPGLEGALVRRAAPGAGLDDGQGTGERLSHLAETVGNLAAPTACRSRSLLQAGG